MQATMSKADARRLKKLKLKAARRDQYKRFTRSKGGNFFYTLFLILFGLFSILPMYYCIITSFKPLDELLVFPPRFYVISPTFASYLTLPSLLDNLAVPLSRYAFNSIFISVVTTFLHVLVGSAAAYVLAKTNIPGKKVIFAVVQMSLLYNGYTLEIPRYLIYSTLGMIDTYWALFLPSLASTLGVFLCIQNLNSFPNELLESGKLDGAGEYKILWKLVVPNIRPVIATMVIFQFQAVWNQTGGTLIYNEALKPLATALSQITSAGIARAGAGAAASLILLIPPIFVFVISQSNVMQTMVNSGIKD